MQGVTAVNARSLATRRVMKTIARRTQHTSPPVRASDGSVPIVVVLPDDKLVDMSRHVAEHFGGAANVFVPLPDHIALIDFSISAADADAMSDQRGHDNASMAMYIEYLKLNSGAPSTMTVSLSRPTTPDIQPIAYAF